MESKGSTRQEGLYKRIGFLCSRPVDCSREHCYKLWCLLLGNYSNRKLSFDRDKIKAIEWQAAAITDVIEDQLVQGIWLNDIRRSLLWLLLLKSDSASLQKIANMANHSYDLEEEEFRDKKDEPAMTSKPIEREHELLQE